MVQLFGPRRETVLFEISVPHLQNYHTQELIKRTKYAHNSVATISHKNAREIERDFNLVTELEYNHKCKVSLGLLVVGAYGEVLQTEEHNNLRKLLVGLGTTNREIDVLVRRAAYSVATQTCRMLQCFASR